MQTRFYLILTVGLGALTPRLAAAQAATQVAPVPAVASDQRGPATRTDATNHRQLDRGLPTLTLSQAFDRIEEANLDVAAARARAEQAAALTRQVGAQLRPTLLGSGSYVRNNQEVSLQLGNLLGQLPGAPDVPNVLIQPLDAWSGAGTLRVPLFLPSAWFDDDAARAGADAARSATLVARQNARAGLAQLAYGTLALEEVVLAAERAISLAREQAQSAQRRVEAGTAAPLDVLRAKAEQVRRESDLARARADLEQAQLAIGVMLGRAERMRVTAPRNIATPSSVSAETAFARRPELSVLRAQEAAGRSSQDSAQARFLPQVYASGTAFASSQPYPTGQNTGWRVAVELTVPLYDGGFRYGKQREAEATVELARLQAAQKRLAIRQEVADATREIRVAEERLRLAESRSTLARDAAASAQRSFNAGIATSLDVLDANDKLFQAEVALAAEGAHLAQARVELSRAQGSL